MIPILYEKDETAFVSNGLGRLRDCISCIVTEERNGIYEIDFEYPVDGHNFGEIKPGRIVGATHEDGDDVQPFDIVSYERNINGTVTFHGVHISYRQLGIVAKGSNINSLASAFTMLSGGLPSNPFSYETDFESSAFMASGDGIPRPVRQFIGGVEGSILDTYGGELLFDKWTTKLLRARGEYKPVTVRYGLNLTEYNEDADYLETYTSAIPYWVGTDDNGNDVVVVGDLVNSGLTPYNNAGNCAALDLSDKFETKPSKADLQAFALTQMTSDQTNLPSQSIEVKYIDLKDFGEYDTIANLIKCKLCDTINVVFPRYGLNARFKIVKTEYNVLQDRFESMELGKLSTSLSEALGLGSDSTYSGRDEIEIIDENAIHGVDPDKVHTLTVSNDTVFTATNTGWLVCALTTNSGQSVAPFASIEVNNGSANAGIASAWGITTSGASLIVGAPVLAGCKYRIHAVRCSISSAKIYTN